MSILGLDKGSLHISITGLKLHIHMIAHDNPLIAHDNPLISEGQLTVINPVLVFFR